MITLIILCLLGALCLLSEIFNFSKYIRPIILTGLAVAIAFIAKDWNTQRSYFYNMVLMDNYSLAFSGLLVVISFLWFLIAPPFLHDLKHRVDNYALILFSLAGGMAMVSFSNIIVFFLGLEILSISMYILAGSNKKNLASNEAALKYFLLGAFATSFLLFGIALIYGQTGSFNLDAIASAISKLEGNHKMFDAGLLLIMVAMLFKVSAAPFHFWAPDVYEGSPTIITTYMTTVVKTAAFAAFLKLFFTLFNDVQYIWSSSIWIIVALTILLGNITAVFQKSVKRMLAYSSISHAGYMLIAILALNASSAPSLLFYTVAYSLSSLGAFTILLLVNRSIGAETIESFNGLAKKNPLLATATVIATLSLAGIPPTAGFFAKYYIFAAGIQSGLTTLIVIAIIGSLIGVYYYFRLIIALFKEKEATQIYMSGGEKTLVIFSSLITILLGIFPELLVGLLR